MLIEAPISRRRMLALTAALPAAPSAGSITSTIAAPIELLDCTIAGCVHYQLDDVRSQLRVGLRLHLEREPNNPHDQHAIAIYALGAKLGYIPRLANRALARRLDQHLATRAEIAEIDPERPWEPPRVRIWG